MLDGDVLLSRSKFQTTPTSISLLPRESLSVKVNIYFSIKCSIEKQIEQFQNHLEVDVEAVENLV